MKDSDNTGVRIKLYRLSLGMSSTALADKSGVSRGYLYRVESGECNPTVTVCRQIAGALGISLCELLEGKLPYVDYNGLVNAIPFDEIDTDAK